jgi:uncharacterized membrane protein
LRVPWKFFGGVYPRGLAAGRRRFVANPPGPGYAFFFDAFCRNPGMTDDGGYDLKPADSPPRPAPSDSPIVGEAEVSTDAAARLKPGDPGWVPPVPVIEKADADEPEAPPPDPDVEQSKGLAVLGYIFFLIPLLAAPNSKFARFHANQGLLVFIALVAVCVATALLQVASMLIGLVLANVAILRYFLYFLCGILQIALLLGWLALVIQGIVHAANGEKKPLPFVGHWTLLK